MPIFEKGTSQALRYYYANQGAINAGHLGEYVAIANNQVQGYYNDFWSAFRDMASRKYALGTFNINPCVPEGQPMVDLGCVEVRVGDAPWRL
jgi:hypothetical protein